MLIIMKKILVIHTKYRITGGEDIAVDSEVATLKKYFNVETLYFSNKDTDNFFKQIFSFIRNKNPNANKILTEKLNKFNPDLVYIHNTWFKPSLGIFKILDNKGVKYYLKLHNYRFDCGRYLTKKPHLKKQEKCKACGMKSSSNFIFNKYFQDSYLKSLILIRYSKKYFKLLKNIKIITLTEFQKKYLIDLGMNTKNINTLVNPISISEGVVKEFNFSIKKNNYLIYAGLVSEEKGVDSLISTYNLLVNFEKTLVIAGDGPLLEKLKYKYKNNEKIIFTGKLTNFEVLSLIKNSYTTITNTSLYEGQPTLLSEASKLQINSIYPSSGGIQEFFPKDNPFAFKANNEIDLLKKLKLLRHEEIVKDQAKSNKKFIEEKLKESNYISKFREIVE
tara:strand:- start:3999 stop:5171 length:1173 start_codon:yes stop_codon:yes gene_type:complete